MLSQLKGVAVVLSMSGAVLFAQAAQEGQQPPQPSPDFTLRVFAYFDTEALEEFTERVQEYVELRRKAGAGLPPRRVTRNPEEFRDAEEELAERIREVRANAQRGEIFVPPIESGVKRLMILEVDSATLAAITEDNPGEFALEVNKKYPDGLPLSTVPPNVLKLLPRLAEGLEYRFVGRHLILRDTQANVIIDHIPYALECTDCAELIGGSEDEEAETR